MVVWVSWGGSGAVLGVACRCGVVSGGLQNGFRPRLEVGIELPLYP